MLQTATVVSIQYAVATTIFNVEQKKEGEISGGY
jgi:hypothetical protein